MNTSNADIENIKILFRYGSKSPLAIENEGLAFLSKTGIITGLRKFTSDETGQFSTFHFDRLNPKSILCTSEPIQLFSSSLEFSVPLETKDKIHLNKQVELDICFLIEVFISATDCIPKRITLKIRIIHADNINHLMFLVSNKMNEKKVVIESSEALIIFPDFNLAEKQKHSEFYHAKVNMENIKVIRKDNEGYIFLNLPEYHKSIFQIPL